MRVSRMGGVGASGGPYPSNPFPWTGKGRNGMRHGAARAQAGWDTHYHSTIGGTPMARGTATGGALYCQNAYAGTCRIIA
jgi:hypothetical protein